MQTISKTTPYHVPVPRRPFTQRLFTRYYVLCFVYYRRGPGQEYVKSSLGDTLMKLVSYTESLEIDPVKVRRHVLVCSCLVRVHVWQRSASQVRGEPLCACVWDAAGCYGYVVFCWMFGLKSKGSMVYVNLGGVFIRWIRFSFSQLLLEVFY